MESNISFETIEEFWKRQMEAGVVDYLHDGVFVINLSRLLREDKSINLELIEALVQYICDYGVEIIRLTNITNYFTERGILALPENQKEEISFIMNFIKTLRHF
jgi:hypothetical protein